VAVALLKDPRLLILAEPSNGLDLAGQLDMRRLIRELGGGRTIVLSSHDMDEVEQLCGGVGIISGGRLLARARRSNCAGHLACGSGQNPLTRLLHWPPRWPVPSMSGCPIGR
jgi:ABC-2 type transport system ATP-binding protein